MEKNFDDIILENNNKSDKVKKILLRIIALVILFLVVMIVMRLLNGSDDKANQTLFPAEPNATEFENIPVSQGGELDEFEALKQQMQGFESNASVLESNNTFVMPLPSSEINATQTQEPTQPAQPSVKPAQKPAQPSVKPADKPATTQKPATAKPATQKPATQTTQKPATKPATTTSSGDKLAAGSYVQVYSVSKLDTKSRDLKKIEQNGYKYSTRKGGESIKVLIGPFDADELSAELAKIRANINKDAFVVNIK